MFIVCRYGHDAGHQQEPRTAVKETDKNHLFLKDWANVGQIAIKPGIANQKAQIVIGKLPANGDVEQLSDEELNEQLFG